MTVATPEGAIAITGMACLFPSAPDLDAYWRNIVGKVDAVSDPPPGSWDPDVYYDPEFTDQDATYCKRGGYLGSLATFAPLRHGIPPLAVGGEPDQWLALQVAYDALQDAGAVELPAAVRERTAIVLGKGTYLNGGNAIAVQRGLVMGQTIELLRQLHPEYSEEHLAELRAELQAVLPPLGPETVPGLIPNIIVGRIANRLDLMGPAYTVDAACASSLVALQHAVRQLRSGEIDLALAGGSQVWMPVATLNLFCRLGALSRTERLRAFDAGADGTLLGEGIGMVVLKRAEDAVRDGDRIYAVVRGVGVASDGRGAGIMAPRVEGEEQALRRAYADAGVEPASVGLIEAHGTGTPLGDVVELEALKRVFGEGGGGLPHCALGTVKTMISHTIPAAGIAGVIKTALSLYHRLLPPTLHVEEPNPKLELERSPFYLNTETRPWIHGGEEPRRAGVNAFGFGGINAHAVLEELDGPPATDHRPPWDSELCLLEAASAEALADAADELVARLDSAPGLALADVAHTLAAALGPAGRQQRLAVVATSVADLRAKLEQAAGKLRKPGCTRIKAVSGIYYAAEPLGVDGKVVVIFPGEGAQYPGMLGDLCLHFDEARAVFDRIDRLYDGHARGYVLSDWVFPRPAFTDAQRERDHAKLMELDIAVESVLTASAALYAVVGRLLPRVDAMVGHSTGEHAAAMFGGALDLETDERLGAFCRGLHRSYADAAARHDVPGAVLLAIGAGGERVTAIAEEAGGELYLAMDNCPHQAVLVGEPGAAARAREIAAREGLVCEVLPYDRAVHTPMFAPFAEDLRRIFADLPVRTPSGPLWSCTTASPYPEDPEEIRSLLVEHWTSPVRFRETIDALYADGARVFVEAGPRGNMTAFVEDILRGRPACAVAADVPRRSSVTQLNHMAGLLAVHGLDVDLDVLRAGRGAQLVDWEAAAAGSEPELRIALSTQWPMLTLAPEALERLRRSAPAPKPAPAGLVPALVVRTEPPGPHGGGDDGHRPGNGNGNGNGRHAVAAAPALAAPVATLLEPAPEPVDQDHLALALAEHHTRMTRFLDAGEAIMQAYLGAADAPVAPDAAGPLVGAITDGEPGVRLVARRTVDPAEDRYLRDHTLGRDVSRTDPGLTGLALMPMAMSLEILAEAAAALVPERIVTGLRDVRAHRWLAWQDAPRTLEVRARRLAAGPDGHDRVRVELHEVDDPSGPGPAVEATVVLADSYPAAPPPPAPPLDGAAPGRWAPGELYADAMFHGPAWQGVEAVDAVAPHGATARLRVLPRDGLLAGTPAPAFALDPVVLDAAGQLIGFWAAQELDTARVVFPFRLAALDLHRPACAPGEPLTCVAAIERHGDQLVRSDIDVRDDSGRAWMRLTGWEDKRFDVPAHLQPLTRSGALTPMAAVWAAPAAGLPAPAAARRIDVRLPADEALWLPVWAGRVLGRGEREAFAALDRPQGRRLEWLGARTAAKEALAELLRPHGLDLLPADIAIGNDERGMPTVTAPGLDALPVVPLVSLSHAGGRAAAVALLVARDADAGLGIDVEPVRTLPERFAAAALTPDEREHLGPLPPDAHEEWLLRCWCAKEAAAKATGAGFAHGTGIPAIVAVSPAGETIRVRVAGRELTARTCRDGDLVAATVLRADDGGSR